MIISARTRMASTGSMASPSPISFSSSIHGSSADSLSSNVSSVLATRAWIWCRLATSDETAASFAARSAACAFCKAKMPPDGSWLRPARSRAEPPTPWLRAGDVWRWGLRLPEPAIGRLLFDAQPAVSPARFNSTTVLRVFFGGLLESIPIQRRTCQASTLGNEVEKTSLSHLGDQGGHGRRGGTCHEGTPECECTNEEKPLSHFRF
eukprot:scaffold163508_cov27-Tisochrysis_lutea.AAC.2